MKPEELSNEIDRKHAKKAEKRHRVRTYKDKPVQSKEVYYCSNGCGYPVPYSDTPCGECICEQDSE
jgi:hypothetical protein